MKKTAINKASSPGITSFLGKSYTSNKIYITFDSMYGKTTILNICNTKGRKKVLEKGESITLQATKKGFKLLKD